MDREQEGRSVNTAEFRIIPDDDPLDAGPPVGLPSGVLRRITLNNRQAREIIDEMGRAISFRNDPPRIFRRAGEVVSIGRSDSGVGIAVKVEIAEHLTIASAAADFVKVSDGGDSSNARPAKDLLAACFANLRRSDALPILVSVTPTPILREDGEIIETEGYDHITRTYFAPRAGFRFGHVPARPTREEAEVSLEAFLLPFGDMPFATETDRANFLAMAVTAVIRGWFQTVPFAVIEAPIQGSGKTLLGMCLRALMEGTTGVGAAPEAGKDGDSEWRKRITADLLTAPAIVIVDNVKGTLGGAALAALSTSPTWRDRLLGTNKSPELPNCATWLFTTNNAAVDADLIRRCVFVRLDPRDAAPHLRTGFAVPDLVAHVLEHRGQLLAHLYAIVRHWIEAGRPAPPAGTPSLGSFEKWSRVVPGILSAVGVDHVLGDLEERAALMRDPDEDEAGDFLSRWWGLPRLRERTTARELVDEARSGRGLLDLPSTILRDRDHAPSLAKSLGRWATFRRDRIVHAPDGGAYVIRAAGGSTKHGLRWRVEQHTRPGGDQ